GFRTCVLAEAWVDDSPWRSLTAALQQRLRAEFHVLLESCRIGATKTEPGAFRAALEALRARPQEV
ncbi:HYES hydrolase, partial [Calcarius ornatus]|nr:HYES hydrolase [Calcarius ornatus]